ncbi:7960_t:CDS:10 [Paraglomus occultum]|uniref:7960_t:CDS:1 n=1 Tax=Paraglomus occultum TaxID=144539 RepID=A0A9N9F7P8_9GLOM|nr:7960_t:CDS:10 [Paraglomus occultum]
MADKITFTIEQKGYTLRQQAFIKRPTGDEILESGLLQEGNRNPRKIFEQLITTAANNLGKALWRDPKIKAEFKNHSQLRDDYSLIDVTVTQVGYSQVTSEQANSEWDTPGDATDDYNIIPENYSSVSAEQDTAQAYYHQFTPEQGVELVVPMGNYNHDYALYYNGGPTYSPMPTEQHAEQACYNQFPPEQDINLDASYHNYGQVYSPTPVEQNMAQAGYHQFAPEHDTNMDDEWQVFQGPVVMTVTDLYLPMTSFK